MKNTQHIALAAVTAAALASAACSGDDDNSNAENGICEGVHCGSSAPACVTAANTFAFPSPAWTQGATLSPPDGDKGYALMQELRPIWAEHLLRIDGFPVRPTILIPLGDRAEHVDATDIHLFAPTPSEEGWKELEVEFQAELSEDGRTLIAEPLNPFPTMLPTLIVGLGAAAVTADGSAAPVALAVCNETGSAYPEYADALTNLPDAAGITFALPMRMTQVPLELPKLYEALKAKPVLEVTTAEARNLDDFGEEAPTPEVQALLQSPVMEGLLTTPSYQADDGTLVLNENGVPVPQGTTKPGFIVALPSTGTAPYPVVLFQHGGTQNRLEMFRAAGPLAEAGFAFVAIDLPMHGMRPDADGAKEMDFLNFEEPLRARGNLRQASADHLAVLTGIAALNQSIESVLGVANALDPSEAYYEGLSIGGVTGTMTFVSASDLKSAALFVAGGGFPEMLSAGMFRLAAIDVMSREGLELSVLTSMIETLMAGADPLSYVPVERRDAAPRSMLFFEAIDDPIMPPAATDQWARAFGATLADPFHHEVVGVQSAKLPASGGFSWKGESAEASRFFIQSPLQEVPKIQHHAEMIRQTYAQEIVASCFSGLRDGKRCEVIDSGYSEH